MNRKELYLEINDIQDDFAILKRRVDSYFQESKDTVMKLDKCDNKFIFVSEGDNANYGEYIMNDILQDIAFMESELNFLMWNKEDRLKIEIIEHLESLEEKIKQTSNKLKQLNMDIKEAFYTEVIKGKALN